MIILPFKSIACRLLTPSNWRRGVLVLTDSSEVFLASYLRKCNLVMRLINIVVIKLYVTTDLEKSVISTPFANFHCCYMIQETLKVTFKYCINTFIIGLLPIVSKHKTSFPSSHAYVILERHISRISCKS